MKRKVIVNFFVVVLVLIIITSIFLVYRNSNNKKIKLDNVSLKESVNDSFALMLEQTNGTYEETTDTKWPSEGYSFNKYMSGCIDSNGNTIENTLTYKNGTIKLKTKHNTYCYIYFDIDRPATEELLVTVPEEQLWNSTLEDDGYRYVGINPDNYICFGTTDQKECMNDTDKYMYRIIGIFEDSEGQQHLKLIKKEALNTAYAWHSDNTTDTDWDESDLYKGINGSYFATNIDYSYMQDNTWNNLITTWNYTVTNTLTSESNGPHYFYQTPKVTYLHEMNRSSKVNQTCIYNERATECTIGEWKSVTSRIGLMYASDFQLSLGESALNYINNVDNVLMKKGWIHISNNDTSTSSNSEIELPNYEEWIMSRFGVNQSGIHRAWRIHSIGYVDNRVVDNVHLARPVFYLEANTKLDKGTGTIDNPYTIETSPNLREYCEEYNNINECIENEENNIEAVSDLWNSTLEEDGIRYIGTNPNNYVCFGTTNMSECTTDTDKYMYRIIGIFEDSEGKNHLKLIKKEALNNTYKWHSVYTTDTDWDESDLYKGINGEFFATNPEYSYMKDSTWNNLITTWEYTATNTLTYDNYAVNSVYGPSYHFSNTKSIYLHEMKRKDRKNQVCYDNTNLVTQCEAGEWKNVNTKISLMYASDYVLSLGQESFNYNANSIIFETIWLHMNNNDSDNATHLEWTMSRMGTLSDGTYRAWVVDPYSGIGNTWVGSLRVARPVFYLTESIKMTSGKGSITEPFILS